MDKVLRRTVTRLGVLAVVGGASQRSVRFFTETQRLLSRKDPDGIEKVTDFVKKTTRSFNGFTQTETFVKGKAKVDGVWRAFDVKLTEFGFTPDQVTNKDLDILRYLISVMLLMWLVFAISPPPLTAILANNFTLSANNAGRVYPFFTSLLLHTEFLNVIFSCLILYTMAPAALVQLGRTRFWQVVLGGGLFSNCYFIMKESSAQRGWMPSFAYQSGMSSCCSSLITVTCLLKPNQTVMFFFLPVRALYIAYFVVGFDVLRMFSSATSGVPAIHVGGGIYGAAFTSLVLRRPLTF
ncbi:hypothetical protein DIPPA_01545 [Diplonema papillatum]|nr:hypothetical protein DIPPA_01545 [Diplonema papillatum]|eukprot:gene20031-30828_t